jgi:hypothetical protein
MTEDTHPYVIELARRIAAATISCQMGVTYQTGCKYVDEVTTPSADSGFRSLSTCRNNRAPGSCWQIHQRHHRGEHYEPCRCSALGARTYHRQRAQQHRGREPDDAGTPGRKEGRGAAAGVERRGAAGGRSWKAGVVSAPDAEIISPEDMADRLQRTIVLMTEFMVQQYRDGKLDYVLEDIEDDAQGSSVLPVQH